jgi:signal transduction histidine kinase/CheY-like chemotaxis protein/HPt (histidine-containing phosphotransfer) domain-containing protein
MIRPIIIFFLLLIVQVNFGQNKKRIAELEQKLKTELPQDRIAEITFELSKLYESSKEPNDINKAIEYAKTSIAISNNINYTTKKIKAIHQLGQLYRNIGNYKQALIHHNQGLNIAKEYANQKAIATAYINIGKVYAASKEEDLAKENFLNAIKIGDKIKNPLIKSIANSSLGDFNKQLKKDNISTQYYIEALDNILQTDNIYMQGIAYKNVGIMQRQTHQNEASVVSLKKSLQKFEIVNDKKELSEINFFLGEYYQEIKDYDNAIIYMKNSLGFAELSGHQTFIKKGYENLANVYERNNDFKNAYNYQKYYCAIKDTKLISELEAQLEIERKNGEIALINQQRRIELEAERTRTYILLFIAIIVLIFSITLYYNLRQKNKINKDLALATKAANKSKQEKEEFFTFTSHEIRTPLNAVVGMTQLLGKTNLNETQTKYLKTIKSSANNILFLVNDVLDLAKLEKGAIKLEKVNTSIREIVLDLIDSLSFKTHDKEVTLSYHIDESVPNHIKADPLRINQILLNLTDNALKFTEKGTVQVDVKLVETDQESATLRFTVKDTGIGISNEKIEKIFESYQQASIDTSRHYGGTGLGLAITKQLVELMGSKIEIESKVNHGTTFSFTIKFPKSETEIEELANDSASEQLSNVSILAVDDTDLNRSIFYDLVYSKENNVEVTLAEDGQKAIELSQRKKFDVIMMDLQMPVLNGFETTKKLREDHSNPNQNTPIIAMTAHVIEGVSTRCDEVGMNDYISKPINTAILFKKIKQYINVPTSTENKNNSSENTSLDQPVALKTSLVDLSSLSELVGGNPTKIIKYIDLFLKNIPHDFALLKEQFSTENWSECAKTAHKIKGNVSYMGIQPAKELLIEIEKLKKEVGEVDKNSDIVDELEELLNQSIEDLNLIKQNLIT